MPQVGGGAALEEDDYDDAELDTPEGDEREPVADELEPEIEPDPDHEPEPEADLSDEARARTMGWHPLAEFRGDVRRWVPAAEFIRRSETEAPIMRDQNRRLQEKVAKQDGMLTDLRSEVSTMRATIADSAQAVREMRELAKKADERGYKRALAELNGRRREAVETGDTEAFDAVESEIRELEAERAPLSPPPPAAPARQPEIDAFIARPDVATWWDKDAQLTRSMLMCHGVVQAKYPDMPLGEQLDHAFARLRAEYPERFEGTEEPQPMADERDPTPAPRTPTRATTVARPSTTARTLRPAASRWEQITDARERAEAKQQYERQRRHDPGLSVDEFLDIYLDPHADVLTIQSKRRKA